MRMLNNKHSHSAKKGNKENIEYVGNVVESFDDKKLAILE